VICEEPEKVGEPGEHCSQSCQRVAVGIASPKVPERVLRGVGELSMMVAAQKDHKVLLIGLPGHVMAFDDTWNTVVAADRTAWVCGTQLLFLALIASGAFTRSLGRHDTSTA
jgi:hypothetical protein